MGGETLCERSVQIAIGKPENAHHWRCALRRGQGALCEGRKWGEAVWCTNLKEGIVGQLGSPKGFIRGVESHRVAMGAQSLPLRPLRRCDRARRRQTSVHRMVRDRWMVKRGGLWSFGVNHRETPRARQHSLGETHFHVHHTPYCQEHSSS